MSGRHIEDGTGRGFQAKVDSENRLKTRSVILEEVAHVSRTHQNLFVASTGQIMESHTITAVGGTFLIVQNLSATSALVFEDIFLFATTATIFLDYRLDVSLGTLANETALNPVNLYVGSPNDLQGVNVYGWDEVGDGITGVSNGSRIGWIRSAAGIPMHFPLRGGGIVAPGHAFTLEAKGAGELTAELSMYLIDATEAD